MFDGTEITSMNNRQMRKVRTQIGMIFQNYNLIDRTSVIKNVLHGRLGQMSFWESVFDCIGRLMLKRRCICWNRQDLRNKNTNEQTS